MSVFRFRRFSVENVESAMKVNTDGVLLGALMTVRSSDRKCLDVGTGTGTIALMAAQRLSDITVRESAEGIAPSGAGVRDVSAVIFGIDIDGASAREAGRNFAASPWPGMLAAVHSSLEDFAKTPECDGFDHVFSNPPYYDLSLAAPDFRRNTARHTGSLSYRELLSFSADFLSGTGILSVILPADTELWLFRHARMSGLYPFRIVRIRTTGKKKPSRIVAEFSRVRPEGDSVEEELLTIHDGPSYTSGYAEVMKDFYLDI